MTYFGNFLIMVIYLFTERSIVVLDMTNTFFSFFFFFQICHSIYKINSFQMNVNHEV